MQTKVYLLKPKLIYLNLSINFLGSTIYTLWLLIKAKKLRIIFKFTEIPVITDFLDNCDKFQRKPSKTSNIHSNPNQLFQCVNS